jgi:hypothetical protein
MKKIILSAAVAAMAFSTSAMAADKGIDITTNGQAVVYYQTADNGSAGASLFNDSQSIANAGIQLDLGADLGNNFTFGSQLTYLTTSGLENNLVNGIIQTNTSAGATINQSTTDDIMLTKIFVAKKIGNTTLKIGRQELPMSLSPLAFSEGWNVFKNTFDAIVAVNTDLPSTTVVAAYVSKSNDNGSGANLAQMGDLTPVITGNATTLVGKGAYMLTAQTTLIPMTTLTASYYSMSHVGANSLVGANAGATAMNTDAIWIDAKVAPKDAPMGLNVGLQYGQIMPENLGATQFADTEAMGIKVGASMDALSASIAYTSVDGDDNKAQVAVRNVGTGNKTPLFTQMVTTETAIALDADAVVGAVSYNMGDMGAVTVKYGQVDGGNRNLLGANVDYNEFDLIYSVKAGGVNYFAAYVNTEVDNPTTADVDTDIIRLWARYNF